MENKEKILNNQINELIEEFTKSPTISNAIATIRKIRDTLSKLANYYASIDNNDLEKLTIARDNIWDAIDNYNNSKLNLVNINILDERGQFTISASRGAIILANKKYKSIIPPKDVLTRIRVASAFMNLIREIKEVPEKAYNSVRQVYKLTRESEDEEFKKKSILFLRNWVKLILQWKIELLSFGVIVSVMKGDIEEYKKIALKHVGLSAQLRALVKGQKYQKLEIINKETYQQAESILKSKYYDLTKQKDILFFISQANPIQDVTIPSSIYDISFKELFPKTLEE